MQQLLQGVEHLDACAQRLAEAGRAQRHNHELLEIERVVRMRTAIDDVHLGHG